jgi:hypothetical protein
MTVSRTVMGNNESQKAAKPHSTMYSCRLPLETIARAKRAGDHLRGGTSEAIRRSLNFGLKRLESSLFGKAA